MRNKLCWLAGAGLILGSMPGTCWGQVLTWNNPAGGAFNTSTNWTPNGIPGTLGQTQFNLNSTYTVSLANSVQNLSLVQSQGNVTLAIGASNTYTLTSSLSTAIGNTSGQTAILNISSGKLQINTGQGNFASGIGTVAGSNGTLRLQGAGTTLTANSYFDVGESGSGRLEVFAGASASIGSGSHVGRFFGSNGVIEVANGTLNMSNGTYIGDSGNGEVILSSTSTGTFGPVLRIGEGLSSTGKLTIGKVSGGYGVANTSGFILGNSGSGMLTIQALSTLNNSGEVQIASDPVNSTGTATLVGGTWNQSGGSIYVGGSAGLSGGTGSINLSSQASLNVTGAGNGIVVRSTGTLTINSTSTVTTPNLTNLFGTINVNGGSLIINGGTFNNSGVPFSYSGNLTLKNSAILSPIPSLGVGSSVGSTFAMESGSTATVTQLWLGAGTNTTGTANITNSTLTTSRIALGVAGGAGILDIGAGGTVNETADGTFIGMVPITGNGTVRIRSGGVLNSNYVVLGNSQTTGLAHINGNWNITNDLEVGGQSVGLNIYPALSATMNLNSGGTVAVGGVLKLYSAGVINMNGGTLQLTSLQPESGIINFNAGTIKWTGSWNADYDQLQALLGTTPVLRQDQTVEVGGHTFLSSTLTLNGGTFRTETISNLNKLSIQSGLFELTNSSAGINTFQENSFGPQLVLGSGSAVRISYVLDILGPLYLSGGSISASTINNQSEVIFTQFSSSLGLPGNILDNAGRIRGSGRIQADLNNTVNGRILVENGQTLLFAGVNNHNNTNGTIEMTGGTIEFTNTLNNNAGGFISGRGTFRGSSANTSGIGLNNQGVVAFSAGVSDVYGKVTNTATGQIITAGAGTLTFHDDVVHNGMEIRTGGGSRTIFLGTVSGAGPFTGTGTVEYQGDLRPGNSPANVMYAGSVEIGASATSHFEIGGILAGSQYDRLTIAGSIILDGRLDIALINSFLPGAGQQFTLIDNLGSGDFQGNYLNLAEGTSFTSGGQLWTISYHGGDGNNLVLTAVPEPATWALLGLSGATSAYYIRRRYRSTQLALDNELVIHED